MVKRFISYYKPVKKIFIIDMVCAFVMAVCDLFYPMITRNIINIYVPNQQFNLMVTWLVALGLIYLLKVGLNYYITYYGHIMGVIMQANMRKDIFEHLQDLPFVFFDENKTGSLTSRIINDLMEVSELAHHGPEDLFISLIMLVGSFVMLSTINFPLALIVFSVVPFLILIVMKLRIRMSDTFLETRETIGEVNATIENSISGIRVSKAFSNKQNEIDKFENNNHKFQTARKKAYKVMAEFHVSSSFVIDFLNILVLSAGGIFFFKGWINFGDFAAFILYISNFLNPIRKLINFVEQYQSGISGFKRFTEVMDAEIEKDEPGAADIEKVIGDIQFNDVTFSYGDDKEILKDISFKIDAGKTVAFVGPSGGGKTTLCHLIPRFYETEEGTISIDNKDIKDFTRKSLRKSIGIVQQDVFLFTGTIYDNILCGKLDATDEEIQHAAKMANIHDFIMDLPDGYNTYVGERGVKLSGGQKQRISIARVFLKNPPILILDEATSALDNATELLIQNSLEELSKGRTTVVVAHRLSTIKNADEIIVLTDKGIQEKGRHEDLIKAEGIYAELYNSQFKNLA
ncbi:MAG: ABC transporter ATP-binding protein [Sedimentibacter saalensis]|jgi:ATP-binding cassette subfamily B protein|uniref:ATP-binding cassette subfamily B protein n=1 Tax=Sedimentibacter saalensis TaxID=130788 RepID=A0A562JJY0_9FIRM|nr:ABC transporter ATP-binding protein [Sedimentibacter saalensis]MEA5094021.1 ABC transporter ATP-binding protein [Sedimentibacter saalensis]TWH83481.1 ATP-binding cassette subfamily B protein [Sedimentibacter saalensis]